MMQNGNTRTGIGYNKLSTSSEADLPKKKIRCAIYTRKSCEEGLEQEFNSLDAQRLAGENFVASQVGKGWVLIPECYDDGGFSGGNIERPALQRLFRDIRERKIDCVVIYKIDRLSRSLFDFQNIIKLFEEYQVTFASVTQNFTTDDSVGRLMLNIVLSFAQYERELTGERIRDKVKASKKKGLWMGGNPSLGYDIVDRKLVVNDKEAQIVNAIFTAFLKNQSITRTAKEINLCGFTTKTRITRSGNLQKGDKFNKQSIRRVLENPIYVGKIRHKDQVYDGIHQSIITEEIWQRVKSILENSIDGEMQQTSAVTNSDNKEHPHIPNIKISSNPLLKGILRCGVCGKSMMPTYTMKKGRRYRYYLCQSKAVGNNDSCKVGRLNASEIEGLVVTQLLKILKKPEFAIRAIAESAIRPIEEKLSESQIINAFRQIENVWDELFPSEQSRIVSLLIQGITVEPEGLNMRIFRKGLGALSGELLN